MVKVWAPMMSLDASGTLGNAITFSKWKGRNYVRERVIPSNPKSGAQIGRRAMFGFLTQYWGILPTVSKATWQPLADQLVVSRFNAFISANMERWHNFLAPSFGADPPGVDTPSDNVLTAAVWEENRIKISVAGAALNDAFGLIIYGSLTTPITEAVGNCILVERDLTIAAHDYFWTPPEVNTWYFDSMTFAEDGVMSAAGGEQSAVP